MSSTSRERRAASTQASGVSARSSELRVIGRTLVAWVRRGWAPSGRDLELGERLAQLAGRLKAVLGGFCEQSLDERLVDRELQRQGRQVGTLVLVDHLHRRAAGEGLAAGEHLVEHDAEAVEVAARIDELGMSLLRAHVVRGAEDLAGTGELRVELVRLRQAKIDEAE